MKYRFIGKHEQCYPVELQCQALGVSRSGYYVWRARREKASDGRFQALVESLESTELEITSH